MSRIAPLTNTLLDIQITIGTLAIRYVAVPDIC